MDEKIQVWLNYIVSKLERESNRDFAGLGLIFYRQPLNLPVRPLALDTVPLDLPSKTKEQSAALLDAVSRISSPFHDGFHLIDAKTLRITHISQFFAPPIIDRQPEIEVDHPIGARFMAAYLGSFLPGVELIVTLSKREDGLVFKNGIIKKIAELKENIIC